MSGSGRVLVVEDSPTQGRMAVADLEGEGFDVVLAASGEEALECLTSGTFDVVLSDIMMPGIDGYELCRRVKEVSPNLPVVLLTSLQDPLDVVRGLQAGADNFHRKPYDRDQLVSRLRTMMFNQDLRRAGKANMGLELQFLNQRFMITSERQQILDLLVSTFEDLVHANQDLRLRESELADAQAKLEAELRSTDLERQRLQSVLAAVPETLVMVDANGIVTDVSDSAAALLGIPAGAMRGHPADEATRFISYRGEPMEASHRPIRRALEDGDVCEVGTTFDLLLERPDGTQLPVIARAAPVRDDSGAIVGAVELLNEISGLVSRDPLTKLPTQTAFLDRVERAIADGDEDHAVAVIAVVIDRFGLVREALPPAVVDGVLVDTARLLTDLFDAGPASITNSASAAFLGNDTFAVLLAGLADDVEAVRAARTLLNMLPMRVAADGVDIEVTATMGVAVASGPGSGVTMIAAAAATARRASAEGGRCIAVFNPEVNLRSADLLRREAELRRAIDAGELRVHYQPVVHVASERIVGVEALVRWQHPELGLLAPVDFIPVAESSGLVVPLGWWVLRHACGQVRDWHERLSERGDLTLAVNLSALQLAQPDAAEVVRAILEETGLPASALVLEITETSVNADSSAVADQLRELKQLGVRLAIDDFGTGYSTLVQLRHFPVDEIKIDREFIAGMTDNPGDAAIVASSVALGRNLGLDVVAEGVERVEQLAQLRSMGCDFAQGFYWSPARPSEELEAWIESHEQRPTLILDEDQRLAPEIADRPRDEILAYLVHEFRNSLMVIRGYAELIAAPDAHDVDAAASASTILRATAQLNGTLDLLGDVAVVERGQLQLQLQHVDVAALTLAQIAELRTTFRDRPVHVTAPKPVPASVDPSGFNQILRNLVSNAAKFSPPDTEIEVSVALCDSMARVAVRDHGGGVPEERRPELFRRFSRLGAREKGTGLGLYLSRLIARAHGGDVVFEPAPDGGSRFVLVIPSTSPR